MNFGITIYRMLYFLNAQSIYAEYLEFFPIPHL